MKKHVLGFFVALASVFAMVGCDVGLGEVVDTQAPALAISYPPLNATIRDSFILYGTWSDDKGVSSVSVKVVNTETKETVDSLSATVNSDKTWQVSLNEFDSVTGCYKYKDGTYQVSITAYDGAGHSSGESSRTYDIDNTAPVFVISNPGVVKSDNLEASAYGSVFTIDGTIADDHTISLMDVAIYDASGSLVSHETYDSEQIDFFREEEISTAGGTSVTIAQYADSPSTTANTRYSDVYGTDSSAGTKYYYASVTLTDSAQIYQNPTGSERSAADVKTDSLGNATSKVYLYDDVYTSLMSAKKGLGLSAADLKNILNGTVSNDSALSVLNESVKDTASSEDSRLYFSLNPEANPTYTISGYTFGFNDGETVQSASNGNTVNVTINSGLDGVKVDPSTLKLWMYACEGSGKPTETDVSEKISNLASKVKLLETNASSDGEETITESQIAEIEETGWTLVYDYYAYNGSTVDVKSIAMTLPSSGIVLNKYYILAATGYDADDVPFSQKTIYGFAGNVSGIAPTIEILTPENGAFVSADSLEFTGTALVNNDSLHVSKLQATISAWNGSIAVGDEAGYSVTLTYDATEAKWTSTNSEAFSINGTAWSFVPSKIDGFLDATADATKYTLSIYGESSSGHSITMSSMVQLDTTAPVVSITTVTPTVSGADVSDVVKASNGYDESNVYINGTVRIMGSIVEQNLASVTYDILASEDLDADFSEKKEDGTYKYSILDKMYEATKDNPNIPAPYDGELGASNSIDVSFMTSMVTQGMIKGSAITKDTPIKIRVVITATDEVGNTGTYSSDKYNGEKDFIIYQETDRPKITFGNADSSVTSKSGINSETNLFGTTSNNKLSLSFEDDDSVAKYEVYLYNSDGTTLAAVNEAYGDANPYSLSPNKTTASLNYLLPETEGVYQVKVVACDSGYVGVEDTSFTDAFRKIEVGNFFIAVDSGAPTLSVDSVSAYVSTSDSITGTVSPSTKSFDNGTEISAVFLDSELQELATPPATLSANKSGTSWEFPLSALPSNTSEKYILKITATDKYQQKSSTNVTFSMDPNAPTITEPTSEQTVYLDESRYVTLNVVVNDDDGGSGLSTVGYYLLGENSAPSSYDSVKSWTAMNKTNEDWRTTFDISSVKNEDGVLYAFFGAKDNAGNTQVSTSSIKLTIDKTAPAITVTGFDGNAVSANGTSKTTDGDATFSVTVSDTNIDSDSLASDNEKVVVGTATDVTGGKQYPITVNWTSDSDGKIEDSKTVKFTATDENERTATYTVTLSCDNSAPVVTLDDYAEYASSSVELTGTVSDTNFTKTSSNFKVYLLPADSAKTTKSGIVTFGDSDTSWSATFTGLEETSYDIVVVAKDSFGNSSAYRTGSVSVPDDAGFTGEALSFTGSAFNVDVNAPELTENSVTIGTSSENASQTENFYYNGGADSIYISGQATDLASGIASVVILPYSKTATDEITATYDSTSGTFTATIANSKITKSGTIYAKITDKAGNSNEVNLAALTYDATPPKIQSYALSDNTSGYTAYNSGKDSSGNAVYYVNNGTAHTFTLSGIATDNLGLSSAVLSIGGSTIAEITDENSLSEYSFGDINLTSLTGDATAKITLTDKAGNTSEQEFTVKPDTASPEGVHETDSDGKDYTFRLGSGTGGKYSAGTYGNASTIQIRGYFNETGSGTNMIYYKLFSGSAPTAENAETFLTNYESKADGYFSPLSSEESAEVSSSADNTTKTVKTNFKSNITGFQEGKNYLLLVAVDNVGNADLDKVVYSYTDESGTEVPVAGCYSINVDTTLPSVESDVSSTILTNGNGDITISGTAADSDAGIDSVTVKITVGTATYSSSDTDSKITVTTKTASDDTDNNLHWTATISKDAFSSVSSGNFTVYATATDMAGEGNSQTVSVANISVDKVAPTVTLTKPATADSSKTDNTYINGTIGLSGTIKDANTLPDTAITGIQVSTDNSSWKYVSSDSADSESIVMDSFSFEGNYTFTVSGFDTTKLDDETEYYIRAVAVDAAGNTGYSDGVKVKVSQDTDRPVVKITNLSVSSDGSYILRYGTDSQITATVTDDDGIDSVVISGSEYTGSESAIGGCDYTASTGTVTFTPADKADGAKTFYVYVKDSEGKEFYTTAAVTGEGTVASPYKYLSNPKISVANADIGNDKEAAVFTYVSDSTSPVVGTVEGLAYKSDGTTKNGGYNSETASYTEYETVGASYVVGGTERQNVALKISASDKNGIAGMTAELSYKDSNGKDVSKKIRTSSLTDSAYSEYTENGSLVVSADDSTSATWTTTDLISLADAATGSITLTVTPYDKSGLVGNGTFTFVADQSGPTVKVTSPSSTEHVSGSSILVSGIATDVGGSSTSTIQWGIPNTSGEIDNWQGELTATSSVSAWSFNFDGSSNASFSEFLDSSKYKVSENDDSIWTIPVHFKATDLLGNETVYEDFSLLYDPDADRPQTTLSYPGEADKKSGESYAILGGTIRATGSVEIPDGSTSVWAVYMQISDDNGEFGDSDRTRAANEKAVSDGVVAPTGYGYTVVDAAAMEENWREANSKDSSSSLNFHSTDSDKNSTYRNGWWGIKVTKNSGSWYVNLNSSGELNSNVSGSTNNIKVRFCGVSAEGKVGHWTEAYSIHIDSNVPKYTTAMYKYSGDITSVSNLYTKGTYTDSDSGIVTASKIKPYEADMYLKGQWYAFAKITDESSVKITGVKRGTTSLTYGTDYFVYPEAAGNDGENSTGSDLRVDSSDSASYVAYVWVKIDPSYTTTQTYTITAKDSDGTPNYIYPAFELNTDNTAPSLTALTDDSDTAISMTKLRNSDHGIPFKTAATDTGSGFDKLLFYFKRTVTNNSTATTTIELPLPAGSSGAWTTGSEAAYVGSLTETDSDLSSEGNELYGVTLSGTSSSDGSSTTFTASSDISSYKFIRKGGVIKLSGIYYVISDVSGKAITVDSAVSGSPTSAFAAAAMVLDHVSNVETDNWDKDDGTCNIVGDEDEDGFVETIKKSGSTWTCEAKIMGNQLEDGPISLVTVAFDKAENVTTTTTNVMIANNTPRLAKVFLATDLNGDGKYTDNEFGSSKIKNLNQTYKFYSALTNGTEGSASEVVTLSQSSDEATVGLTMRDSLSAAFEFVSGDTFEGYGSGNGDLYYKLDVGTEKLDKAQAGSVSATDGTKLTKLDSMSEKFASVSDIEIGSTAVSAKNLTGLVITPENITSGTYGTHDECTSSEKAVSYIGLTLWDSTKGTTPGVGDTVSDKKITAFGSQSTVVNIPIYIDLTDDVDPKPTFADPTAHADGGHVELSSTLPSATFKETSGEKDTDTKISGKVVFTGTVSDEKRISSIKLTSGKAINSTLTSAVEVASYDTTNGLLKVTDAASATDGWTFTIKETTADEQFSVTDGHKVTWTLTLDSSYVENIAASDVKFTLTASDGTNGADAEYQVDIVPYITGIVRGNTTISGGTMNRSNIGRYPVAEGETLKVSGYNLGTSGSWTVGTNNTTTSYTGTKADDGTYSFTMIVPARSGNLSVKVNSISSLNNDNDNSQTNNLESFKMSGTSTSYSASDNRYLSVWNLGNYFNNTLKSEGKEFEYPVMTAKANGDLVASWGTPSNGSVTFSYGLAKDSTAIYNAYDQPGSYTGVAFDQKGDSGAASVMYMAELQGNGGTYSVTASASDATVGGAVVTQIGKDDIDNAKVYSGKKAVVTGNPSMYLDGDNTTGFYTLQNYDMQRRLGIYKNPQAARYGNYLHNIWYDSQNESLKYSVVNLDEGDITDNYSEHTAAFSGWVLVDGNYTQQDRVFEWTTDTTGSKTNNKVGGAGNKAGTQTGVGSTYNPVVFSKVIFLGSNTNKDHTKTSYIGDTTSTSLVINGASYATAPEVGDSIALLDNTNGGYKILVSKITKVDGTTITWEDSLPDGFTIHSATIYQGNMNVVGGNDARAYGSFTAAANQSSSAGSSAAIDVTTDGYPVVAYYDATNSQLRLACASVVNPSLASKWTRVVPGVSCSGEVSLKVDGANNVHIMYNNEDGQMCYLFGKYSSVGSYTWSDEEVVDENGSLSYGSISVVYDGSSYVPAMTYLNKANTANGVKYAYRTVAPAAIDASSSVWDFMIIPALGNGHYALKENKISLESSNNWTSTSATVLQNQLDTTQPKTATPATVDSVIAYKTSKAYETAYLKKE